MVGQMFRDCAIQHLKADGTNFPAAAGATAVTSDFIDTDGFDEVLILGVLGAMVATATCDFKLQGSLVSGSGYTDIASTALGQAVAATDADCMYGWDITRFLAQYRYFKVVQTRATANVTIQSLIAIKCQAKKRPKTQTAGSGQFVVSQAGLKFLQYVNAGTP